MLKIQAVENETTLTLFEPNNMEDKHSWPVQ